MPMVVLLHIDLSCSGALVRWLASEHGNARRDHHQRRCGCSAGPRAERRPAPSVARRLIGPFGAATKWPGPCVMGKSAVKHPHLLLTVRGSADERAQRRTPDDGGGVVQVRALAADDWVAQNQSLERWTRCGSKRTSTRLQQSSRRVATSAPHDGQVRLGPSSPSCPQQPLLRRRSGWPTSTRASAGLTTMQPEVPRSAAPPRW